MTNRDLTLIEIFGALLTVLAVVGWLVSRSLSDSSGPVPAPPEMKSSVPAQSGSIQDTFELARTSRLPAYNSAQNEIQKSAIFREANEQTAAIVARNGSMLVQWAGKIKSITTDHGGTAAAVAIKSRNDAIYHSNEDIASGSEIYDQLATLHVGEKVLFTGRLINGMDGSWETSITEEGSLEEPEFNVSFDSIVPFDKSADAISTTSAAPRPLDAKKENFTSSGGGKSDEVSGSGALSPEEATSIGPSFNCSKAFFPDEKAICGSPDLSGLDRQLAEVYSMAKVATGNTQTFRKEQNQAIIDRRKCGSDKDCIVAWYEERRQQLRQEIAAHPK